MDELCTYQIEVQDGMDTNVFNATSPLQVTVVQVDPDTTHIRAHTDQSGLVGLLRHLHQQGFLLLSVQRDG